jgi:hypothetical protein
VAEDDAGKRFDLKIPEVGALMLRETPDLGLEELYVFSRGRRRSRPVSAETTGPHLSNLSDSSRPPHPPRGDLGDDALDGRLHLMSGLFLPGPARL